MKTTKTKQKVSATTVFEAEGARAGLVTCEICGAAILLDPREKNNRVEQHLNWHKSLHPSPRKAK
jgi:transcription elongation factor Elf1